MNMFISMLLDFGTMYERPREHCILDFGTYMHDRAREFSSRTNGPQAKGY
jgi:hypothetical protein